MCMDFRPLSPKYQNLNVGATHIMKLPNGTNRWDPTTLAAFVRGADIRQISLVTQLAGLDDFTTRVVAHHRPIRRSESQTVIQPRQQRLPVTRSTWQSLLGPGAIGDRFVRRAAGPFQAVRRRSSHQSSVDSSRRDLATFRRQYR